jgi:hypothetical protein
VLLWPVIGAPLTSTVFWRSAEFSSSYRRWT